MGKIAQVTGVLRYNDATRDEALRRIYWKDVQYTRLGGNFVKYASISTRNPESLTGGEGLFNYTFGSDTDYAKKIRREYLSNNTPKRAYSAASGIPDGERWRWYGDYWEEFTPDNELQHIATKKIAEEMKVSVFANNDRFLTLKYITPELSTFYGSSPGLNTKLLKYTFGQYYTGRIHDIDEANVKLQHDYLEFLSGVTRESVDNLKVSAPKRYMFDMLDDAGRMTGKDYLTEEGRYVNWEKVQADKLGMITNIGDFKEELFKPQHASVSSAAYNNNRGMAVNFNEGDVLNPLAGITEVNEDGGTTYNAPGDGSDRINDESMDFYYKSPSEALETKRQQSVSNHPEKSLLYKTNVLFRNHRINTLAARFHTSAEISDEPETTDTAKSKGYGNSHGRNLLKKNPKVNSNTNGYDNPYCRVWTYHHQYDRVSKLIRPFGEGEITESHLPYTTKYDVASNGREYLNTHTVLGSNGFVKIAPKSERCNSKGTTEIKNCMFSLENLAWKDVPRNMGYLSNEQRGPNGGRIMWFPPYDLDFNESVSVNWNQNNFIGRGEPVYTYSNTVRQGTLSFAILIDHPSIIDNIPKNNIKDTQPEDLEGDILRFFAGCQIPDLTNKDESDCETVNDVKDEQMPGDEPKFEPAKQEKAKHVKFYVYFPNNYSGNSVKINKSDWNTGGSSDRAWFDYIVYGVDTEIGGPGSPGYEIGVDGVSQGNGQERSMEVHSKNIIWSGGEGIEKGVWYKYRVDFDLHQKLHNQLPGQAWYTRGMQTGDTYLESSNYLDSKGFMLNSSLDNNPKDATHTFMQILASIVKANSNSFNGTQVQNTIEDYAVDELVNAFKDGNIEKVEIKAGATKQDPVNSKMLAERRYRAIKDVLTDRGRIDEEKFPEFNDNMLTYNDSLASDTTVNSLDAKRQRFASVEIWFDAPEVQKLSDTTHPAADDSFVEENDEDGYYGGELNEAVYTEERVAVAATETENITARYETEAEYFHEIQKEHPLIYKNLVEKFKYFSPAYHSISPEGFNARLTFLQQCTRQGHTISATDLNYAKTAGNLSFGRMPVCVLRIGDFINTKIIINSMSINYGANGAPQWDLNPEGIGVQPMYAKVQLGITILGGQSLEGPINRLQNAVSFNYYANTGVYDNRSDRINVDVEKKVFSGVDEEVREITMETSGDKIRVWDESEYGISKTTYTNIWSPHPNLVVRDDDRRRIGTYNEYKARGIEKGEDGKYRLRQEE